MEIFSKIDPCARRVTTKTLRDKTGNITKLEGVPTYFNVRILLDIRVFWTVFVFDNDRFLIILQSLKRPYIYRFDVENR